MPCLYELDYLKYIHASSERNYWDLLPSIWPLWYLEESPVVVTVLTRRRGSWDERCLWSKEFTRITALWGWNSTRYCLARQILVPLTPWGLPRCCLKASDLITLLQRTQSPLFQWCWVFYSPEMHGWWPSVWPFVWRQLFCLWLKYYKVRTWTYWVLDLATEGLWYIFISRWFGKEEFSTPGIS